MSLISPTRLCSEAASGEVLVDRKIVDEVDRLCGVIDARFSVSQYLAGAEDSIADMITWSWASLLGRLIDENVWETFPHLKRWVDEVGERPAVQRGRAVGKELGEQERTAEEAKARLDLLFNQTNDKVRAAREAAAKHTS